MGATVTAPVATAPEVLEETPAAATEPETLEAHFVKAVRAFFTEGQDHGNANAALRLASNFLPSLEGIDPKVAIIMDALNVDEETAKKIRDANAR